MNVLDLIIGLGLASAVIAGWRIGLLARVASWIGAIGGFLLVLRLMPYILERVGEVTALTRLFITMGSLLFMAALGGAAGEAVGRNLRRVVAPGPAQVVDRAGGAAVGALGLLVSLWLFLPVMADVPGAAARLARNSVILSAIQDVAPRPPDFTQTLRRLVGDVRIPDVFEELRPAPDIGPPPSEIPVPADVVARATASTVNVESEGCNSLHEGSGFAVADDTVVTNAHVVAGGDDVKVRRPDGRVLDATVVHFDPDRDLAVLTVPGLGQSPLAIADGDEGTEGAVIGYPGGQNTPRVAPAVVRRETTAVGRDIYNSHRTSREVLFLAAALRQGDSGAAFVDAQGRVVGVAFAIAPDRADTAYALDTSELREALAAPRRGGTGPCI